MRSASPIIAAGVVNRRLLMSLLLKPRVPFGHAATFSSPLLVLLVLSGSCSFFIYGSMYCVTAITLFGVTNNKLRFLLFYLYRKQ